MSEAATRDERFWTPEPLFNQQTVFVLGGGPSLAGFDVERLRDRRVFAVNMSLYLCPWADLLFFMDTHWFNENRAAVEAFPGVVVTGSRHAKAALPDKLKRVGFVNKAEFEFGTHELKFCRTSGHAAVAVAIAMRATRIVLLGFDMRLANGRSHYHDAYGTQDMKLFRDDFLIHFQGWNEAARRCGVRIINCTPDSALTEFPVATLDEVLVECS